MKQVWALLFCLFLILGSVQITHSDIQAAISAAMAVDIGAAVITSETTDSAEETEKYWTPERMRDAKPMPMPTLPPQTEVFCTMDAKECPDGSYVSRTGPHCQFAPCPGELETLPSGESTIPGQAEDGSSPGFEGEGSPGEEPVLD